MPILFLSIPLFCIRKQKFFRQIVTSPVQSQILKTLDEFMSASCKQQLYFKHELLQSK